MKRDMDLAREILLKIEQRDDDSSFRLTAREDEQQAILDYHIELLVDAHFIQADKTFYDNGSTPWNIESLTWEGHDFLDAARDQTRWEKAKRLILEQGGRLTLDALRAMLLQQIQGGV